MKWEARQATDKIQRLQNSKESNSKSKIKKLETSINNLEKVKEELEREVDNLT